MRYRLPICLPNCLFAYSLSTQKSGNCFTADLAEWIECPWLLFDPLIHSAMNIGGLLAL